jgi:hypothetical protein
MYGIDQSEVPRSWLSLTLLDAEAVGNVVLP